MNKYISIEENGGIVKKQIETFAWCARSLKDQWQGTIQHSMQMGR